MRLLPFILLASSLAAQKPTLNPPTINFGPVKVGVRSATLFTTLTNPLAVVASRFAGGLMVPATAPASTCTTTGFCYVIDTCVNPLPASGTCTLSFTFQPATSGVLKGANIVNFADGTADTINLIGSGIAPPAVVAYISFYQTVVGITIGSTYQFSASAFDSTNRIVITPLTWTSSNKSIATIDSTGLARGLAVGVDTITASSGTISKSTTLTVAALPIPPATQPGLFLVDLKRYSIDTVIGNYGYKGLNSQPWAIYDDSTGKVVRHFIITVLP